MTSGASATSSAAYLRVSSTSPPLQRVSIRMLRPSVQPNCCSTCTNAAMRAFPVRIVRGRSGRDAYAAQPFGLLRSRGERPSCRPPAEQRDELASFQLIELHSVPPAARAGLSDIELAQDQSGGNENDFTTCHRLPNSVRCQSRVMNGPPPRLCLSPF